MNKQIREILVFGNVIVAIAAFALGLYQYQYIGEFVNWNYLGFLGLGTFALYNVHRYFAFVIIDQKSQSSRIDFYRKRSRLILIFFFTSFLATTYFFFKLKLGLQFRLLLIALLPLFYTVPFIRKHRIRDLPYIKIGIIAFLWTYLCYYLPMYDISGEMSMFRWVEGLVFVFAVTLPFDIRDYRMDLRRSVKTFATLLGKNKSYWVSISLLFCCIMLNFIQFRWDRWYEVFMYMYLIFIILFHPRRDSEYFTSFWLESAFTIPLVLLALDTLI